MRSRTLLTISIVLGSSLVSPLRDVRAQPVVTSTVDQATAVLQEFTTLNMHEIPESLLREAQGIAIIPNVLKVGFVAGVRHGRGVVLVRDQQGNWQLPMLIELTGGSVGWQAGAQSTDVVLIFRSRGGLDNLLRGTLTLGADAAVAAGPTGRNVQAATDIGLKAEILSYSRSRGLFAGLALDGSVVKPDRAAHAAYYQIDATGRPGQIPPSAMQLTQLMARATGSAVATVATPEAAQAPVPVAATAPIDQSSTELTNAANRLFKLLDAEWKKHLELPPQVMGVTPDREALRLVISRYEQVIADPRYQALAARPEFQETYRLLRVRAASLPRSPSDSIQIPPPPSFRPGP